MSIFDYIRGKDEHIKLGRWKMLRRGLHSKYDFAMDWYLLRKQGVVHNLTEADCDAIIKDLTGVGSEDTGQDKST